jgi:type IV pilus assembly protein PilC
MEKIEVKNILTLNESVTFFSELSSLYSSGIPLSESISILIRTIKSKNIKDALSNANLKINNGTTLAEAFYSEGLLSSLYYSLIILGEKTGTLDIIIKNIVIYAVERLALYRNITSKLLYPLITILAAILITPLPEAFKEGGSYFRTAIVPLIFLMIISGSGYFIYVYFWQNDGFRKSWDTIIIKIPYIGRLIENLAWIRFCTAFSICIGSGLDIISTAELSRKSFDNRYLESQTIYIQRAMTLGIGLSEFLAEVSSAPSIIIEMAKVGETTGTLDQSLQKAGIYINEKVTHQLSVINVILPIVISLLIAIYVGYKIVTFYMNYFSTLNQY